MCSSKYDRPSEPIRTPEVPERSCRMRAALYAGPCPCVARACVRGTRVCMCVQELAQRAHMFGCVCACMRACGVVQAMTWFNLLAMCLFLGNGASGVVVAILQVVGVYSKANAAGDEDSLDEAWIEGSGVPDAFHVSRPMKHWRRGYGFAFDVNHSEKKPYLVCFASGSAKRCALAAQQTS